MHRCEQATAYDATPAKAQSLKATGCPLRNNRIAHEAYFGPHLLAELCRDHLMRTTARAVSWSRVLQ